MKTLMLSLTVLVAAAITPISAQTSYDEEIAPAPMVVAQPLPFSDNDYSDLTSNELVTRMGVAARASRQLALIARGRAESPEVRAYAERVLADQSASDAQLASLAKGTRSTLPTALDLANQQTVDRLMFLLGPDFDREYLKFSGDAYSEQITLLQAASQLKDPIAAEFANTRLLTAIAYRDAALNSTATAQSGEE